MKLPKIFGAPTLGLIAAFLFATSSGVSAAPASNFVEGVNWQQRVITVRGTGLAPTDAINQTYYDAQSYEESAQTNERFGATLPYVIDDSAFFNQLQTKRLSIYDDGAKGSVHFIHLQGLHTPYTMDENAERHGRRDNGAARFHV